MVGRGASRCRLLSIVSVMGLPIFLRQKGSPESKPVDASHDETGE
ncbi:DUF6766 family protein [Hymenobacter duratus]|nr:DUF6766 family protein [Hymenobacter duratus]